MTGQCPPQGHLPVVRRADHLVSPLCDRRVEQHCRKVGSQPARPAPQHTGQGELFGGVR